MTRNRILMVICVVLALAFVVSCAAPTTPTPTTTPTVVATPTVARRAAGARARREPTPTMPAARKRSGSQETAAIPTGQLTPVPPWPQYPHGNGEGDDGCFRYLLSLATRSRWARGIALSL